MSFLNLEERSFLITGVSNKKSVATFAAKSLQKEGAKLIFSVQNEAQRDFVLKEFGKESVVYLCQVQDEKSVKELGEIIIKSGVKLSGLLHSIAFANFSEGIKPFHQTLKKDFLEAFDISCFSLISLSNAVLPALLDESSIVTISISTTTETSYGYMGPIKAALDCTVSYLAKSLSARKIRVNAVGAGPLKTSASAGIPNYIENYLFAEKLTLRKAALKTQEVADSILFLLSDKSAGMNASKVVIDAGMSCNHFDREVVMPTVAE